MKIYSIMVADRKTHHPGSIVNIRAKSAAGAMLKVVAQVEKAGLDTLTEYTFQVLAVWEEA